MKKSVLLKWWIEKILASAGIVIFVFLFSGCEKAIAGGNEPVTETNPDSIKGLNDYYKDYFTIGVAVSPASLTGVQSALILKHFGSLTAENVMKPALIHPEEKRYYWDNADKIVVFAQTNGLKVRGHTLVWHQQTPSWFFKDAAGNAVNKEVLLARLKEHITTVVSRYKGKVYAWDVVNEALDDNDSTIYRKTDWYKICGEEYIEKAFQWAHEADPDAILFYNDYNTEFAGKRDKVYKLIKRLLEAGVPVHGIGLQGHWNLINPAEKDLRDAIEKYSKLGLKLQFTELDVSVYSSAETDPKDNAFTPVIEQKQLEKYKMVFKVFREYKNVISGITFWNVKGFNPSEITPKTLNGFVEGDGYVSIEAEHYTNLSATQAGRWMKIEDYGHTLSAMRATSVVDAAPMTPGGDSPFLEYQIYLFNTGTFEITSVFSPTLNFMAGRGMHYAISFDSETPQIITLVPENYNAQNRNTEWEKSVSDNARFSFSSHTIKTSGYHTLKIFMVDTGVVLQKIIVNSGGLKPSYLGPPESFYKPFITEK